MWCRFRKHHTLHYCRGIGLDNYFSKNSVMEERCMSTSTTNNSWWILFSHEAGVTSHSLVLVSALVAMSEFSTLEAWHKEAPLGSYVISSIMEDCFISVVFPRTLIYANFCQCHLYSLPIAKFTNHIFVWNSIHFCYRVKLSTSCQINHHLEKLMSNRFNLFLEFNLY